jgi:hypothetical protein
MLAQQVGSYPKQYQIHKLLEAMASKMKELLLSLLLNWCC